MKRFALAAALMAGVMLLPALLSWPAGQQRAAPDSLLLDPAPAPAAAAPPAARRPPPATVRMLNQACVPASTRARVPELIEQRRWWHASVVAPPLPAGRAPIPVADGVRLGLIAEGLGRWPDVAAIVSRVRDGDSTPAFVALAARSAEASGAWMTAIERYRRLQELPRADADMRDAALARTGAMYERAGRLDSASQVWRRAAQAMPEIADWFALYRADHEPDTALAFATLAGMRSPATQRRAGQIFAQRRFAQGNLAAALEGFEALRQPLDVARVLLALGRRREARARLDSVLFSGARTAGFLAATLLSERFETLTLAENLAVSRAYRVQGDPRTAERFARRAAAATLGDVVGAWIEVAAVRSALDDLGGALRALDSAGVRAGRARAGLTGAERVRALFAARRWDSAGTLLDALIRAHPGDTALASATLMVANRHRARIESPQETARYRLMLRRFPNAPATNVARLRLGLIRYAAGSFEEARTLLLEAAARDSAAGTQGPAVRYWQARVRLESGDSSAAADLRRLALGDPISFYGVRAREILGDTSEFIVDLPQPLPRLGSFPPARARERIRMLAMLGFDADARAEATGWMSDPSASVQLLIAAAGAASDAGFASQAIIIGDAARRRAGAVLPDIARALFPLPAPFRPIIEAEAAEHCMDPLLMAAIIRQESRFMPRVVSRAGARGIGQVMPATGRDLATRLRLPNWDPDLLFVADHNIHLGFRYLDDRIATDSLPVYAVLAAYNAGPIRVRRWRAWPEFDDPDLFAERVAISETHDYVKTVYMSYTWYRYAWQPPPPPPPPDSLLAPVP